MGHLVDPMLGSMGVGVPGVLGLWENWQQRGLINIAYNNAVQPVEPFIVGAVPVDVGKGGDSSRGEGDWPSLGNKVRDDPGGEASAGNGKMSWGAVGGETAPGHVPVARAGRACGVPSTASTSPPGASTEKNKCGSGPRAWPRLTAQLRGDAGDGTNSLQG